MAPTTDPFIDWITVSDAARELGYHRHGLRYILTRRNAELLFRGNTYWVRRKDLIGIPPSAGRRVPAWIDDIDLVTARPDDVSERDWAVLNAIVAGKTYGQIAIEMDLSRQRIGAIAQRVRRRFSPPDC